MSRQVKKEIRQALSGGAIGNREDRRQADALEQALVLFLDGRRPHQKMQRGLLERQARREQVLGRVDTQQPPMAKGRAGQQGGPVCLRKKIQQELKSRVPQALISLRLRAQTRRLAVQLHGDANQDGVNLEWRQMKQVREAGHYRVRRGARAGFGSFRPASLVRIPLEKRAGGRHGREELVGRTELRGHGIAGRRAHGITTVGPVKNPLASWASRLCTPSTSTRTRYVPDTTPL